MADENAKVPPSPETDTAKESRKQSLADMVKAVKITSLLLYSICK